MMTMTMLSSFDSRPEFISIVSHPIATLSAHHTVVSHTVLINGDIWLLLSYNGNTFLTTRSTLAACITPITC